MYTLCLAQLQFFLPHKDPFIPRKRLLYVVARNDILTLFIYNYSTEQCEMAREIVEKTVLWHNTRSRLLCDIGLHKLGMTHLSALKVGSFFLFEIHVMPSNRYRMKEIHTILLPGWIPKLSSDMTILQ